MAVNSLLCDFKHGMKDMLVVFLPLYCDIVLALLHLSNFNDIEINDQMYYDGQTSSWS